MPRARHRTTFLWRETQLRAIDHLPNHSAAVGPHNSESIVNKFRTADTQTHKPPDIQNFPGKKTKPFFWRNKKNGG